MRIKLLALLTVLPVLAACGGAGKQVQSAGAPIARPAAALRQHSSVPPVRRPVHQLPPPAHPLAAPGLEGVIGSSRAELVRQFGPPRLDVWEGDARKLQFVGSACVFDVYLYPSSPGREPQASYVEARRASDGKDVDRAACISAFRQRGQPQGAPIPSHAAPAQKTNPGG
jgi:predicted small secreted protein